MPRIMQSKQTENAQRMAVRTGGEVEMKCPRCGFESNQVIATRDRNGFIYRRRECLCGFRFRTHEYIIGGYDNEKTGVSTGKSDAPDRKRNR